MQKKTDFLTAIRKRYPEQVVIVTAKDRKGKYNPVTIGWTMLASIEPALMAIAVFKKHYTVKAIRSAKCFTISYPSSQMAKAAKFFGTKSGFEVDKFAEFKKCATSRAVKIDSLLLDDAVANFECELFSEKLTGDHIIFIGRIVASHINSEPLKRLFVVKRGHKMGSFLSKPES